MSACYATGCGKAVEPGKLMCLKHWRLVPADLQSRVWTEWRAVQRNGGKVSRAYLEAIDAARAAVASIAPVPPKPRPERQRRLL